MKLITTLLFTLSLFTLHAQISGVVTDTESNPIEFVNVALYSMPDSTLIAGTITNQDGHFSLNNDSNSDAILRVSFIGYETKVVEAAGEQRITLMPETTELGELVVKGNLPRIRVRDDALVTSIENTVLSKAGTANDVLKRLPSVTGDDGAFEIFGKGAAKIYVNNREMRDPSELDRINSSDIREVEIVYNPGARYDASVKAIIRIYTVRKVGDGFGFDLRSTYLQSENTDLREQLNVNYRKNGLDFFGTLRYVRNAYVQESVLRQTTHVDTIWTQDNQLHTEGLSNALNAVAGINYEFSPKQQAGVKYTLTAYPGENRDMGETKSDIYANGQFYDRLVSIDQKKSEAQPRHRFNGYYNGTFGKLNVDFNGDFYYSDQNTRSDINESSEEQDDRNILSDNRILNRLLATRTILSHPLWGGTFSLGNEFTRTHREDDYQTSNSIIPSSNTEIHDQNLAFFAEYNRATPIGQLTAGLRFENAFWDYYRDGVRDDEVSRSYSQWFPALTYSNQFGNVQLQMSYSVKTVRPSYWQMSSSVFYANRYTLQSGNPFLKPSTLHDISLMSSWRFLQLAVSWKMEKDIIIQWAEQMEDNPAVTLLAMKNLQKMPSLSAFLTASPRFGIWSPQASVGFNAQRLTMEIRGEQVHMNRPMLIGSFNNSFSLPKGFLLTLDSQFQGKGSQQNFRLTRNMFMVNAGIVKSFFDDKLSLTLKGHDLFHGQRLGVLTYNDRLDIYQYSEFDTRQLELTLRYKFNSTKNRYKGAGAGDREIGRMGGS
ncbi:MAG: outer membrane beta-barrel protein [Bacteroidales bacterium]|nr:outer membrane beta-barrel protein [Bacteroidales bacterium]